MAASKWTIHAEYSSTNTTWYVYVFADATKPSDGSLNTLNMVENTNSGSASTGSLRINTALYAGLKTVLNARADSL